MHSEHLKGKMGLENEKEWQADPSSDHSSLDGLRQVTIATTRFENWWKIIKHIVHLKSVAGNANRSMSWNPNQIVSDIFLLMQNIYSSHEKELSLSQHKRRSLPWDMERVTLIKPSVTWIKSPFIIWWRHRQLHKSCLCQIRGRVSQSHTVSHPCLRAAHQ